MRVMINPLFVSSILFFTLESVLSDPIYPVENPCLAILNRLSDVSSEFLQCAVSRARPFKLCEGCVESYARLQDLIHLLTKTYSDRDRKISCQQFLESYDSIQLVAQIINFVENVWSSSVCDHCITHYQDINGTVSYVFNADALKFFEKKVHFDQCIYNVTGQIVPIIPMDLNVTMNSSVCTSCSSVYNNINDFFLKMTQTTKKGVCMDLVDTMNYTRLLWSKIYACRRHDPDYMAVIGISLFIPTIVLVFYVSAVFKGERKEKKLSRQKRLPRRFAAHAQVDTQTRLWSNPNE